MKRLDKYDQGGSAEKKLSCFRVIPKTKALKIHYKSWREREKKDLVTVSASRWHQSH